jgi:hypothetical protein
MNPQKTVLYVLFQYKKIIKFLFSLSSLILNTMRNSALSNEEKSNFLYLSIFIILHILEVTMKYLNSKRSDLYNQIVML